MRDVFSSLPSALRELAANEKAREAVVAAAWRRAVGPGLTEQTAPLRLDGKVLTVAVSSETWKKNIVDLAGQILFKLNGSLGSPTVSYIEFEVDPMFVRAHLGPQERSISASDWECLIANELSPKLERAACDIEDENLRRQFLRASAGSLARQKLVNERAG